VPVYAPATGGAAKAVVGSEAGRRPGRLIELDLIDFEPPTYSISAGRTRRCRGRRRTPFKRTAGRACDALAAQALLNALSRN
jgi:hypothetical protein